MEAKRIIEGLRSKFSSGMLSIDSHTAGEPTRLIIGGSDSVPGTTMQAKRKYLQNHLDHIRLLLTREPRGHRGIMAAFLTEPTTAGAEFGLIFMDARRYPYLCGHGTIGAVTTLIEGGMLAVKQPQATIIVDTPSGPMETTAHVKDSKVEAVAIQMVPSFVYQTDQVVKLPEFDPILVDTVCVGGFFIMVSHEQIGLALIPANSSKLIGIGMALIDAANQQLTVRHPTRPEVKTIDVVEFYDASQHSKNKGSNVVVYGESHMDRSPCGTGTAAKMTLLHHRGQLPVGQIFLNQSPLGTTFEGRVLKETRIGDLNGVVTEIRGSAQITGIHEFVVDPRDPFPEGFLL